MSDTDIEELYRKMREYQQLYGDELNKTETITASFNDEQVDANEATPIVNQYEASKEEAEAAVNGPKTTDEAQAEAERAFTNKDSNTEANRNAIRGYIDKEDGDNTKVFDVGTTDVDGDSGKKWVPGEPDGEASRKEPEQSRDNDNKNTPLRTTPKMGR